MTLAITSGEVVEINDERQGTSAQNGKSEASLIGDDGFALKAHQKPPQWTRDGVKDRMEQLIIYRSQCWTWENI